MLTLTIFVSIVYVVFGVLAVASLNEKYKVLGGGFTVISMIALIILTVLSMVAVIIATAIGIYLCCYTTGKYKGF
jgi:hypothetical protein